MDIKLHYEQMVQIKEKYGMEGVVDFLNAICNLEIYSIGYGWLESKKYILKGRGSKGDIIVSWH